MWLALLCGTCAIATMASAEPASSVAEPVKRPAERQTRPRRRPPPAQVDVLASRPALEPPALAPVAPEPFVPAPAPAPTPAGPPERQVVPTEMPALGPAPPAKSADTPDAAPDRGGVDAGETIDASQDPPVAPVVDGGRPEEQVPSTTSRLAIPTAQPAELQMPPPKAPLASARKPEKARTRHAVEAAPPAQPQPPAESVMLDEELYVRIRLEIKGRLPYFQACADAARRRGSPDIRRVLATWWVAADGVIKELKLEGVPDPQLATCITRMGSRPFDVKPGAELTVPTPIVFVR